VGGISLKDYLNLRNQILSPMKKMVFIMILFLSFSCGDTKNKDKLLTGNKWILANLKSSGGSQRYKLSEEKLVLTFSKGGKLLIQQSDNSVISEWEWGIIGDKETIIIKTNTPLLADFNRIINLDDEILEIVNTQNSDLHYYTFFSPESKVWLEGYSDEGVEAYNKATGGVKEVAKPQESTKEEVVSYSSTTQKQEEFKTWLLENTAVTEVHFESDWQIWVFLKPEKYTSEENAEQIAKTIAKWYSQKMGKDFTICTIWLGSEVYAKGNSN
jgi:hypothetical protein